MTTTARALAGLVAAGLVVLVAVGAVVAAPAPAAAQRPTTTVAPDGLSATDGQRTLRAGQSQGLAAAGQTVGVAGSGYDVNKGIYVALCVVTPPDTAPSPCGGGIDQTGATGASQWVSSAPPSYGEGLAIPYGPDGTFSVNIGVAPVIAEGFDCRQIQCAIVTRNDHTRTADRTQDIFIPVTFAAGDAGPPLTAPPTTAPATTAPPTTIAPPPPPSTTAPEPAPPTEVSADGLTGTVGERSITLSVADDLDPEGEDLAIEGAGFDPAVPLQVTLCQVAAGPTEAPSPCLAGATPDASRVVAPEGADGDFVTFADDGSFALDLEVAAVIDDETDCRTVDCAVIVRRFAIGDADAEAAAADRTLDIAVPVGFAAESPVETTTTTTEADDEVVTAPVRAEEDADGSSPVVPIVIGLAVVAAAVGAALVVRNRRAAATAGDGGAAGTDSEAGPGGDAP